MLYFVTFVTLLGTKLPLNVKLTERPKVLINTNEHGFI